MLMQNFSKEDLERAVEAKIFTKEQVEMFLNSAEKDLANQSSFTFINVAYYFGAMIVISAMGWFMTLGWESLGGLGITLIALTYAIIFVLLGRYLWFGKNLKIPGGLFFVMATCMTPLAVYGIQKFTGIWPADAPTDFRGYNIWIQGSWIIMELATVAVGLIMLKFVKFPFLTAPIAFSLWYLSMDSVPLLLRSAEIDNRLVSVFFGLVMIVVTYFIDRKTKDDYAFWGYLFGMLTFWGGLTFLLDSSSELSKFSYCLLNVFLIIISVWLERKVFIIFGSLGVFGYLSYLSFTIFSGSILFPFVLSFLGLAIIFLAIKYQKNMFVINEKIKKLIPASLLRYQPKNRILN